MLGKNAELNRYYSSCQYPKTENIFRLVAGVSPHKFLWGGGGYVKSWTSYPGQYSDLSEGATKTK